MKNLFVIASAICISSTASAHDLWIDLGEFPARVCIRANASAGNANVQNEYLKKTVRAKGRIFFDASNELDAAVVQRCAEKAKNELSSSFSPANIQEFGQLFEKYIRFCVNDQTQKVKIIRAFIDQPETCAGGG